MKSGELANEALMIQYEKMSREGLLAELVRLRERAISPADSTNAADLHALVEELQVYQVELEMQNRELREAHALLEESRSTYADLYDFAPVGYLTLDRAGRILKINLTSGALLGTEPTGVIGKPFALWVAKSSMSDFLTHLLKCRQGETRVTSEIAIRSGCGRTSFVQMSSLRSRENSDGEPYFLTSLTDISQRKEMEEELSRSEARARSIIEALPDALFVFDANDVCVEAHVSPGAALWQASELFVGSRFKDCFPSGGCTSPNGHADQQKEGERVVSFSFQATVEGEIRHYDARVGHRGKDQYAMILRDMSAMIQLEESLQQERIRSIISTKMATLGAVAAGIAHEINNPLTVTSLAAHEIERLVLSGRATAGQIEPLTSRICRTNHRIAKVVQCMLRFAHDGRHDPMAKARAQEIIDDTLLMARAQLSRSGVSVELLNLHEDLEILCRPVEISQVLLNLVINSIDAIKNASERWIRIELKNLGPTVEITVTDSGPGIPEAVRARMMEPLFTTKDVGQGTGLGLSISRDIIEAHGGQLSYDPACKNTRFVVKLNAAPEVLESNVPSFSIRTGDGRASGMASAMLTERMSLQLGAWDIDPKLAQASLGNCLANSSSPLAR